MDFGQYLLGVLLAAICLGSLAAGSRRLRARLMPGTHGCSAWVGDGVIVFALLVLVCEALGIVGALTRAGSVIGCVAASGAAWLAGELPAPGRAGGGARPGRVWILGGVAVAVVAAPWLGWTVYAYRHGMQTVDTLWYHLSFAARFAQLGNVLHLQYFDRDPVTVFYPANSELPHALGLIWFHSDLLSPLINLGWAALGLAAAWSIGRALGNPLASLIGALIVLGTPGLVDTQPGGAYNDVACVALLLASAALLLSADSVATGASLLAAAAAGLALGTKFTMIVPSIALAAGAIVISPRGRRLRQAELWLACMVVLGGYWYLRDWVTTGNPLPSLSVQLGPLSLAAPHVITPTFTVAQYLTNAHIWHVFFIPGLRRSLGLAWWALLLFGAAGAIGALLWGHGRVVRMLGAVAVVSAIAFLFTPQFLGVAGAPFFFVANVRYAATPLVLGLVLLPAIPALRDPRAAAVLIGVLVLTLAFTEIDPGSGPPDSSSTRSARRSAARRRSQAWRGGADSARRRGATARARARLDRIPRCPPAARARRRARGRADPRRRLCARALVRAPPVHEHPAASGDLRLGPEAAPCANRDRRIRPPVPDVRARRLELCAVHRRACAARWVPVDHNMPGVAGGRESRPVWMAPRDTVRLPTRQRRQSRGRASLDGIEPGRGDDAEGDQRAWRAGGSVSYPRTARPADLPRLMATSGARKISDHVPVLAARISLAVVALVACAWFALGIRQAHDLGHAVSIVTSASVSPGQAAHAESLLNAAGALNPDVEVKLVRAELALRQGDARRAVALAAQAAKDEPQNVLTWDEVAKLSSGNLSALLVAFKHIRELSPPVSRTHQ